MADNSSLYKSAGGYAAVMAFYDANLKRWPVPYECFTLPTRYGETHLIASGPADAPPLVLMRGAGGNATIWTPSIGYLSRYFRTYALDVIGETGKSAPARPSYKSPAYGEWLLDVFDALRIERANVAGTSRRLADVEDCSIRARTSEPHCANGRRRNCSS